MRSLEETIAHFSNDRFALGLCGLTIEEATPERGCCRMPLTPEHMNALGVAQGGAVFTLCDTTFGVAANAGGVLTVSLGAQITFVRPGTGAYLTAVATLVSATLNTCLYRVEAFNDQNALVAYATFNGFRKQGLKQGK